MLLKLPHIYVILFGYTYERIETKMTVKSFIKRALSHMGIYFSFIMLAYIIILYLITPSGQQTLAIEPMRALFFLGFSLCLAIANVLFSIKKISGGVRFLLHAAITLSGAFACLILPLWLTTANARASTYLVGMLLIAIVYFIAMGIWYLISAKFKLNLGDTESYDKQFASKIADKQKKSKK